MQNIDYSRKLRPQLSPPASSSPVLSRDLPKFRSPFVLFLGAILLFTSGMVVGIQLKQKEQGFQDRQERSFANLGKKTERMSSPKTEEDLGGEVPGLKFPPKNDQINYMVHIGSFTPEESLALGKKIVQGESSFQGRIFRTSSGRLYAGYFYRKEDAEEAIASLRNFAPEPDHLALKTIRF